MKLTHIAALSTAALLAFSIPMLTAKAGCGCGAGTSPSTGKSQSPVSKSDSGSDVHHGDTGLVFNVKSNGSRQRGTKSDGSRQRGTKSGGSGDDK